MASNLNFLTTLIFKTMSTVSTSVLTTTFCISYPDAKSSTYPEFQITATRNEKGKDIFKIMAVVDGVLVEPKGKFAPKMWQSDDLRKTAKIALDKMQAGQTPAVEAPKENKKAPNFKKATAKTDAATSADQTDHTLAHLDKMQGLEMAIGEIMAKGRVKKEKLSAEEKMIFENEQRLEIAHDKAAIEEALAPKTEATPATEKQATAPKVKPNQISFEELKVLVAAGKVSHRSGKVATEYISDGKTASGNDFAKLKLDNGKQVEILLNCFNAWYRISD